MIRNVITIEQERTTQDAAKLMAEHNIGSVIVVSGGKPIGVVTERDLVRKVCARDIVSSSVPISEVMSAPLIWAEPEMELETAVQRMFNNKIRRLPILENEKLVGIVTVTDLAKHLRTQSLVDKVFESR